MVDVELFIQQNDGRLTPVHQLFGANQHFTLYTDKPQDEWKVCETKKVVAKVKNSRKVHPFKLLLSSEDVQVFHKGKLIFKDPTFNRSGVDFFVRNKRVPSLAADSTDFFNKTLQDMTWN